MDVLIERCAGLDVHRDTVVATVRWPGPGGARRSETLARLLDSATALAQAVGGASTELAFVSSRPVRGCGSTRPVETLEHVAKTLRFTAEQQEMILAHFISGQDRTSGGVLRR